MAKSWRSLYSATTQKGYTCIATAMYWKGNKVKCEIALAKGKQMHDKRATQRDRDWNRQKERSTQTRLRVCIRQAPMDRRQAIISIAAAAAS